MKSLASAESAVNDGIKARKELISGLEQLLETHRSKLADEETTATDLGRRRSETDAKRKEVEDTIFRRVTAEEAAQSGPAVDEDLNGSGEHDRTGTPEVEGFTPPPEPAGGNAVEAELIPEALPVDTEEGLEADTFLADPIQEQPPNHNEPPPSYEPPPALQIESNGLPAGVTAEFLNSLNIPGMRPVSDSPPNAGSTADPRKRRKTSHKKDDIEDQLFALGNGIGLDADVGSDLAAQ